MNKLLLFAIFFLLVACQAVATPTPVAKSIPTLPPTSSPTSVPATLTSMPSVTPTKTPTITPSPTATTTLILTPTPTVTPSPTPEPLTALLPPPLTLRERVPVLGHVSSGSILDVEADDNYIYLLLGAELQALEMLPDGTVTILGDVVLNHHHNIYLDGSTVYLWQNGLHPSNSSDQRSNLNTITILDLSDPSNPHPTAQLRGPNQLVLKRGTDGTIYLQNNQKQVWQMAGLAAPLLLDDQPEFAVEGSFTEAERALFPEYGDISSVRRVENRVYGVGHITLGPRELLAVALTNPSSLSRLPTYRPQGDDGPHLALHNGILFAGGLGHEGGGMVRYDVSNPAQPKFLGTVPNTSNGFDAAGNYLYLGNNPGIVMVKIESNQVAGDFEAEISLEKVWTSYRTHLEFDEASNRTYSVYGPDVFDGRGIEILDATDPLNLKPLGVYPQNFPDNGFFIHDILVHEGLVYLAKQQGFIILDVTNPVSVTQLTSTFIKDGFTHDVALYTDAGSRLLFVQARVDDEHQVHLFDVTNPSAPIEMEMLEPCVTSLSGQAQLAIDGDKLYWLSRGCGLQIYALGDGSPRLRTTLDVWTRSMLVQDGLIYLHGPGLTIIAPPK